MEWFATPNLGTFSHSVIRTGGTNSYLECRNDYPLLNKDLFRNIARLGLSRS